MNMTVNYLAVLVAAIAGFATGAIWYTVLFGKPWLKAVGQIAPMGKMSAVPFIVSIASNALMAFVLASILNHGGMTISSAICVAGLIWLGFVLTTIATNNAFPGRPWSLTAIDAGHWLAVLVVQGIVIGLFGN